MRSGISLSLPLHLPFLRSNLLTLPPDIPSKRVIQHLSVDGDVPSDENVDYYTVLNITRIITNQIFQNVAKFC